MRLLRFKPKFNDAIKKPKMIEIGNHSALYKTKTTRGSILHECLYQVVNSMGSLFNIKRTGIVIKVVEAKHLRVKDYTPEELIADVGHCDKQLFLKTLSEINGKKYTMDSILYLNTFQFVKVDEELTKTYKQATLEL